MGSRLSASGLRISFGPTIRAAFLSLLSASGSLAQDSGYLDDRSDPAAAVRSYYNAVGRHEFARAWSYFGPEPPVADYDTFVAGFADTASVDLKVGAVTTEGAAGSIYGSVPVALTATAADGTRKTFAGCYTTRLSQPAIQEPPFRPLYIVSGHLLEMTKPLDQAMPAVCGQ